MLLLLLSSGCALERTNQAPKGIKITEVDPDKKTALMTQNLLHLNQIYELGPLLFSREIIVSDQPSPPASDVVVMSTRFADHPHKILAEWFHQLMLIWLGRHPEKTEHAITGLKQQLPATPRGQTHRELLAGYLEYRALSFYLGEKEARKLINEFIANEQRLPWIFTQVVQKTGKIKAVVEKNELLPAGLN
jgi:hypothetical protein